MPKFPAKFRSGILCLTAAAFVLTCDKDPTGPNPTPKFGSVTIVPAAQAVSPGDTVRLVAEVRDTGGRLLPGEAVAWSSSNSAVVTVDGTGLLKGITEGTATVTATAGWKRGNAAVTVSQIVINPDAVIIDSTRVRLISEDTVTGQYVFQVINGPAPDLDTLSIIVGAQGEGFLRHVDGVRRVGDLIYLETSQAGIGDLVRNGAFAISGGLEGPAGRIGNTWWDESRITYLHPGVRQAANALDLSGVSLSLRPSPDNEGWTANVKVKINEGSLGFDPHFQAGADWGWFAKLKKLEFAFGGTFDLDLEDYELVISGAHNSELGGSARYQLVCQKFRYPAKPREKQCSVFNDETEIFAHKRRFVTWFGTTPLVGVLTLTTKLAASVSFSGDVSWRGRYVAEIPVRAGVGWNGSFYNLSSASTENSSSSMTFQGADGSVTLKLSLVPELSVALYGIVGPVMNVSGYGKGEARMTFPLPPYASWDWDLAAGFGVDGTVGLRLSIFKLIAKHTVKGKGYYPLDFTKTFEIWSSYYPWVELFSDGPLQATVRLQDSSKSQDAPPRYPLRLRPAFRVHDPPGGTSHANSTEDAAVPPDSTYGFNNVRSGGGYLHQVSVPRDLLQGNCSVTSKNPDTVMVRSDLYLTAGGTAATTTFTVDCIPLGDLRVAASITGPDVPPRHRLGYLRVDTVGTDSRGSAVWVSSSAAADTVLEDFVPANAANGATGEYLVSLTPGRRNCAVADPDSSQVFIQSGDTVTSGFAVHCVHLGHIAATVPTIDPDPPSGNPLNFDLTVQPGDTLDGSPGRVQLAGNDTARVNGLVPLYSASGATGRYTVSLGPLGNRCTVQGGAQRAVTVQTGDTAVADFRVTCVERLFVRTLTTGQGTDPDGFEIRVDDQAAGRVAATGVQGVAGVSPGIRLVQLADVEPTCTVSQGGVKRDTAQVTVSASDSTQVTFAISCPAPGPPVLMARAVSAAGIDLAWTIATPDSLIRGYRIFRDGALLDSTPSRSYQDRGLPAFTTFTYRVTAVDIAGLEGPAGTATARTLDATPPGPPVGLSASAVSSSRIALTWNPASDTESGIARYRISRDGSLIDSTTATSYQDAGLAGNTTYSYAVAAVNGDGLMGAPASLSQRTLDDTPPTAPSGLAAVASGPATIALTWSPALDVESGITGYVVYRDGQRLTTTNATQLQDGGLAAGTTYTYEVAAVNGAGLAGPRGAPASATTPVPAQTGDLQVLTTTTGAAESFTVVVEGSGYRQSRTIGPNASALFAGLTPAPYTVILRVTGCSVAPPNPRTETVTAGQTTRTAYAVDCQVR